MTSPIFIALPLLITGQLGYTPTYLSLCYISVSSYANEPKGAVVIEEGAVWLELLLSSFITSVCYSATFVLIYIKV